MASWRSRLPVLAGPTVLLREPEGADVPALFTALHDSEGPAFGLREPVTGAEVIRLVERAECDRRSGRACTWVIASARSGGVAGLVQMRQLDPAFESAEWDCLLAIPFRGSGAFLEAAQLLASFAFEAIGVHRLEARVLVGNGRANGALRKLGAVQEGSLRQSVKHRGVYADQILWSLLREDWHGRAEAAERRHR
jgi:RimJ/RimL family protein N-acetyltransferase